MPHEKISHILDEILPAAEVSLKDFARYQDALSRLPLSAAQAQQCEFYWDNDFFPALDAIVLYGVISSNQPANFIEIGSGFSTKIAKRAIVDNNLQTKLTSIDPCPRTEIDGICDKVIRSRLEDVDANIFLNAQPGDVVFFDGSHRSFTNSDVTVFFLDVLPLLKTGVIVQIHDIPLPEDYPSEWSSRYYNEQYLLAVLLLYGSDKIDILFPNAHISRKLPIGDLFPVIIGQPGLPNCKWGGGSFWFKIAKQI